MRYGSVVFASLFSGIEAASVAWGPLGWQAACYAEIEPFCRAVLEHHYPEVPNLGDVTKLKGADLGAIDLLIGGSPCQSFSVAGKRAGLDDPRGNLTLEFLRLVGERRPRWVVWENVPGVLSIDDGLTFGTVLGTLGQCGYGFAYRVLDAQYFGVPQRRRRVFVVGYFGDWRPAAAVLFERESLSGNPPPRRGQGEEVAGVFTSRSKSGGWGTDVDLAAGGYMRPAAAVLFERESLSGNPPPSREARQVVAGSLGGGSGSRGWAPDTDRMTFLPEVSPVLRAGANRTGGDRPPGTDVDTVETLIAHARRAEGHDASEDGTGRGTPLVAMAFQERTRHGGRNLGTQEDMAYALTNPGRGGRAQERNIAQGMSVRRLTPRECERLQGFSDGYTAIPYRGRMAADGPRYRALGNSMAVPVVRWLGRRIEAVERILAAPEQARH